MFCCTYEFAGSRQPCSRIQRSMYWLGLVSASASATDSRSMKSVSRSPGLPMNSRFSVLVQAVGPCAPIQMTVFWKSSP
jgi:hypothetical protein